MSAGSIVVEGGRLIDPASRTNQESDLYIQDGIVAGIGRPPDHFTADTKIDATGKIVCPGLVDLSARLREPGAEHKSTIPSETIAAARAGITLLCLPPDTDPVIDEPAVVDWIQQRTLQVGAAKVVTLGALTAKLEGKQLSEMAALKHAGCVGVSNALKPIPSIRVLRYAMEYAATNQLTLHVVPIQHNLMAPGGVHDGHIATLLGLTGIPVSAETVSIAQHLALIEETGVKTHFGRLSSARAVEMIADAKQRGLPVTADVAAHHLHLTEEAVAQFNSQAHVIPPLRSNSDRDALIAGLKTGVIDAICSDHQPHERDAKLDPFPSTAPGISGLDTLLGLCLSLVEQMDVPLVQVLKALTAAPADILGVETGRLSASAPADVIVLDPDAHWRVSEDGMNSAGRNTPFVGFELPGKVEHVVIDGRPVT